MPQTGVLMTLSMNQPSMSNGDNWLLHTTETTVTLEVSDKIAAEVALRSSPDATPCEVRDALADHVIMQLEYVTPDGGDAVQAILDETEN